MDKKTTSIVSTFRRVVKKNIHPCRIILFGSRATGKAKKQSDYDFLLISPQFKKWEWEERSARMYNLKKDIPAAMDFLCLTPEEYEYKKNKIGIVQQATKEGIDVSHG